MDERLVHYIIKKAGEKDSLVSFYADPLIDGPNLCLMIRNYFHMSGFEEVSDMEEYGELCSMEVTPTPYEYRIYRYFKERTK